MEKCPRPLIDTLKFNRRLFWPALLLAVLLALSPEKSSAAVVDWTTVNSGTLGPIGVSLSNLSSQFLSLGTNNLSGTNYSYAPLSSAQETVTYGASNDWTVSFAQPVINLLVYAANWRGSFSTGPDGDALYTFTAPFVIRSGFAGASVNGNTLTLPDGAFYSGILEFTGSFNSLGVDAVAQSTSGQSLTFAATVPEPTAMTLALLAGGYVGAKYRGRRGTQK